MEQPFEYDFVRAEHDELYQYVFHPEQQLPMPAQLYFIERVLGALAQLITHIVTMCIGWVALAFLSVGFLLAPSFLFSLFAFLDLKSEKTSTLFSLLAAFNAFLTGLLLVPVMAIILSIFFSVLALVFAVTSIFIPVSVFLSLSQGYQKGIFAVLNDSANSLNNILRMLASIFKILVFSNNNEVAQTEEMLAQLHFLRPKIIASSMPNIEKLEYTALIDHLAIKILIKKITNPSEGDYFPHDRLGTIKKVQEAQVFYAFVQAALMDGYKSGKEEDSLNEAALKEIEKLYNLYSQKVLLLHNALVRVRENESLPATNDDRWELLDGHATIVTDDPQYTDLSEGVSLMLRTIYGNTRNQLNEFRNENRSIILDLEDLPLFARENGRQARIAHSYEMIFGPTPEQNREREAAFERALSLPESERNKYKHKRYSEAEIAAYKKLATTKPFVEKRKIESLLKQYSTTDERLLSNTCGVGGEYVEIEQNEKRYVLSKRYKNGSEYFSIPDTNVLANTAVDIDNLKMWYNNSLRGHTPTEFNHPLTKDPLIVSTNDPSKSPEVYRDGSATYLTDYKIYPYYQYPENSARKDEIYSQALADIEKKLEKICPRNQLQLETVNVAQPETVPQASLSSVSNVGQQQTLEAERQKVMRAARLLRFHKPTPATNVTESVVDSHDAFMNGGL